MVIDFIHLLEVNREPPTETLHKSVALSRGCPPVHRWCYPAAARASCSRFSAAVSSGQMPSMRKAG